jgi:DNA-directed RNA polymerase subunit M/transcription elongation factor TFIIS
MMIKFCPKCSSMQYRVNTDNLMQCMKCNYVGDFNEGSMDEINSFRKVLTSQKNNPENADPAAEVKPACTTLHEKLMKMKGRSTEGCDFL